MSTQLVIQYRQHSLERRMGRLKGDRLRMLIRKMDIAPPWYDAPILQWVVMCPVCSWGDVFTRHTMALPAALAHSLSHVTRPPLFRSR